MNLFRKKLVIKYMDLLKKEDAKNMFKQIPNNFPKYFYSIPKTIFNPEIKKFIPYARTIKTCPGFINLYKRSILVTSPFDLYVRLNGTEIVDQMAGQTDFQVADTHPGDQFLNYVNTDKYKTLLKIYLPIKIHTNVSLHITQSSYHFNNFEVSPGIIPNNYEGTLNFFIPIQKEKNEIYIKKDDPLFLITPLCEKKIKLKFKKLEKHVTKYLTFSTLKEHILKNLI